MAEMSAAAVGGVFFAARAWCARAGQVAV